jgi:hypothetical protein
MPTGSEKQTESRTEMALTTVMLRMMRTGSPKLMRSPTGCVMPTAKLMPTG